MWIVQQVTVRFLFWGVVPFQVAWRIFCENGLCGARGPWFVNTFATHFLCPLSESWQSEWRMGSRPKATSGESLPSACSLGCYISVTRVLTSIDKLIDRSIYRNFCMWVTQCHLLSCFAPSDMWASLSTDLSVLALKSSDTNKSW